MLNVGLVNSLKKRYSTTKDSRIKVPTRSLKKGDSPGSSTIVILILKRWRFGEHWVLICVQIPHSNYHLIFKFVTKFRCACFTIVIVCSWGYKREKAARQLQIKCALRIILIRSDMYRPEAHRPLSYQCLRYHRSRCPKRYHRKNDTVLLGLLRFNTVNFPTLTCS